MAAEAKVKVLVEVGGLGAVVHGLPTSFTDTNTPDDARTVETVLSTTAILLSTIINVPCAEVCGLNIVARAGNVYVNTISTNISTAGTYIPDGQAEFLTFEPGNSCVVTLKGGDADTAVTMLFYSALT